MNIEVLNFSAFAGTTPIEGDRQYICLHLSMSRAQIERAVVSLISGLTDEQAAALLRSEFPELLESEGQE